MFHDIANIFKPIADTIDNLHTSEEEKLTLNMLTSQIEAQIAAKYMELQMAVIEATSKVAAAEQQHGNLLSKSWRPVVSMCCMSLLVAMGADFIPYREQLAFICGGFLGIYGAGRSLEKNRFNRAH